MNPGSTIIKMPLSRLAFTNPATSSVAGNKNLYSIEESDESSLNSSSEDDVLSLLSKGRQSSKSSEQSSSSNRKASSSATKPSEPTSSSSSFISEQIGKLSQSVLEIQMKQQDDALTAAETSKTILQRLSTSEANMSTILTGIQQFDKELKQSNANHKEALLSLKVRLSLFFLCG